MPVTSGKMLMSAMPNQTEARKNFAPAAKSRFKWSIMSAPFDSGAGHAHSKSTRTA